MPRALGSTRSRKTGHRGVDDGQRVSVHQGGDGPLMRGCPFGHSDSDDGVLVSRGANVNALWKRLLPHHLRACETVEPPPFSGCSNHAPTRLRGSQRNIRYGFGLGDERMGVPSNSAPASTSFGSAGESRSTISPVLTCFAPARCFWPRLGCRTRTVLRGVFRRT